MQRRESQFQFPLRLRLLIAFFVSLFSLQGAFRLQTKVVHLGRQTAMAEASLSDAHGKLFAQASTTCLILDVPDQSVIAKS
jgi:hypothetical protein